MDEHDARSRIALALDVPDLDSATRLIEQTHPFIGVYKVGLELFTAAGPYAVEAVRESNAACFLDLKLHDIPATMARAVRSAAELGAQYLTVHASAGAEALAGALAESGPMRLLAVTVLTSFDSESLAAVGFRQSPEQAALALAGLAWESGVRGFVSSAHESSHLRARFGDEAFLVTPGIRPRDAAAGDQKRVMSPTEAIGAGSDLLVIGRPVRDAIDPSAAASELFLEVDAALQR
ncbi:MAG: orotidine-5'-phosphate decarboxylase [Myxococcota bacterium]